VSVSCGSLCAPHVILWYVFAFFFIRTATTEFSTLPYTTLFRSLPAARRRRRAPLLGVDAGPSPPRAGPDAAAAAARALRRPRRRARVRARRWAGRRPVPPRSREVRQARVLDGVRRQRPLQRERAGGAGGRLHAGAERGRAALARPPRTAGGPRRRRHGVDPLAAVARRRDRDVAVAAAAVARARAPDPHRPRAAHRRGRLGARPHGRHRRHHG